MTKFRGKRKDNGGEVKGSLIEARDGIFILETGNYSVLFEEPEYHNQGMGCGLEDRNITDRYRAMLYGWECAMFRVRESYPDFIEVIPEILAMYTMINDKKRTEEYPEGQEIYGSILINGKMSKGGDIYKWSDGSRGYIEWDTATSGFCRRRKTDLLIPYALHSDSKQDIEVIGRQYDEKEKT